MTIGNLSKLAAVIPRALGPVVTSYASARATLSPAKGTVRAYIQKINNGTFGGSSTPAGARTAPQAALAARLPQTAASTAPALPQVKAQVLPLVLTTIANPTHASGAQPRPWTKPLPPVPDAPPPVPQRTTSLLKPAAARSLPGSADPAPAPQAPKVPAHADEDTTSAGTTCVPRQATVRYTRHVAPPSSRLGSAPLPERLQRTAQAKLPQAAFQALPTTPAVERPAFRTNEVHSLMLPPPTVEPELMSGDFEGVDFDEGAICSDSEWDSDDSGCHSDAESDLADEAHVRQTWDGVTLGTSAHRADLLARLKRGMESYRQELQKQDSQQPQQGSTYVTPATPSFTELIRDFPRDMLRKVEVPTESVPAVANMRARLIQGVQTYEHELQEFDAQLGAATDSPVDPDRKREAAVFEEIRDFKRDTLRKIAEPGQRPLTAAGKVILSAAPEQRSGLEGLFDKTLKTMLPADPNVTSDYDPDDDDSMWLDTDDVSPAAEISASSNPTPVPTSV